MSARWMTWFIRLFPGFLWSFDLWDLESRTSGDSVVTFKMSRPALETPWWMLESPLLIPDGLAFLNGASRGPLTGVFGVGFRSFRMVSLLKQFVILSCIKSSVGFSHLVEVRKDLVLTHTPGKAQGGGGGYATGTEENPAPALFFMNSLDTEVPEQNPHPDVSSQA